MTSEEEETLKTLQKRREIREKEDKTREGALKGVQRVGEILKKEYEVLQKKSERLRKESERLKEEYETREKETQRLEEAFVNNLQKSKEDFLEELEKGYGPLKEEISKESDSDDEELKKLDQDRFAENAEQTQQNHTKSLSIPPLAQPRPLTQMWQTSKVILEEDTDNKEGAEEGHPTPSPVT